MAREELEHVVGAGVEAEIATARAAIEEARRLLEGALRRTGEISEDVPGEVPGARPGVREVFVPP